MLYPDPEPAEIKPLLEELIQALVQYPEVVDVFETDTKNTLIYTIDVAPKDRGKIIGRGGRIIDSLKVIFHALGCKQGKRIHLEIKE